MKKACLGGVILLFFSLIADAQQFKLPTKEENQEIYKKLTHQMDIQPGSWRPLFHSEQIAWVSPPWGSQEYIYLDFPEAIFINGTLVYLSHVHPLFPAVYNYQLPPVKWEKTEKGICYQRNIENKIAFGGEVYKKNANTVGLTLWIQNFLSDTLKKIFLQTCAYLHAIKEFELYTNSNKYIHVPDSGWVSLEKALSWDIKKPLPLAKYGVGWHGGGRKLPPVSDLPVIVAMGKDSTHFIAFTWYHHTYNFIGNEEHPCFHADPVFPPVPPHQKITIQGEMIFLEGDFNQITKQLVEKFQKK